MEWPAIWIGTISDEGVSEKVGLVKEMEAKLNEALDLSNYGQGIQSFRLVPMVIAPENTIQEEGFSFAPGKKKLTIHRFMDYEVALASTELDFMRLTASLFLEMLDLVEEHMVKDFDLERFRKDVIAVFEGNGWLENVLL